MIHRPSEKFTEERLAHPRNAYIPMFRCFWGWRCCASGYGAVIEGVIGDRGKPVVEVTLCKVWHSAKAWSPMKVTRSGIVSCVMAVYRKAKRPMTMMFDPQITRLKWPYPSKHRFSDFFHRVWYDDRPKDSTRLKQIVCDTVNETRKRCVFKAIAVLRRLRAYASDSIGNVYRAEVSAIFGCLGTDGGQLEGRAICFYGESIECSLPRETCSSTNPLGGVTAVMPLHV